MVLGGNKPYLKISLPIPVVVLFCFLFIYIYLIILKQFCFTICCCAFPPGNARVSVRPSWSTATVQLSEEEGSQQFLYET